MTNTRDYSARRSRICVAAALAGMALVLTGPVARSEDSLAEASAAEADAILKAMSDYLGSQKMIEGKYDSDIEIVTPQLEKIQFTSSGEFQVSRPNKVHNHRVGGYSEVDFFFDGKTVSVYGKNKYAQFDVPGTFDDVVEALRQRGGSALPGVDLLVSNPYDTLGADVQEAKHLGLGIVDGVKCEHLAFRNYSTDWQLWVKAGDRPVPCKMVVTSKTVGGAPQYTMRLSEFKTGGELSDGIFTFTPPSGAKMVDPKDLSDLDELPWGVFPGEKQ